MIIMKRSSVPVLKTMAGNANCEKCNFEIYRSISAMRSWTEDQDNKYISIRYMWALVRLQEKYVFTLDIVLQLCNIILHKAIIILASGSATLERET
jgi:hypothetical protein